MRKLIPFIFSIAVCFFSVNIFAWNPFKKQTYEECILENMKGVKSDEAAKEIRHACRWKILNESSAPVDSKKCTNRFLTPSEAKLVTPYAKIMSYGWMTLQVHNNNKNLTVTGFKVYIKDLETNKTLDYEVTYPKIEPLKTSDEINIRILAAPKKPEWNIYEITTEVCS